MEIKLEVKSVGNTSSFGALYVNKLIRRHEKLLEVAKPRLEEIARGVDFIY